MPQERLQKIIARAGFASRRRAEEMIRAGQVTINGRVVEELGTKADPEFDHIKVAGKLITRPEEKRYILLNKPREIMTTVEDPEGRKTVLDLVRGVKERIFPVGRLDYHSEGLILLTNDGELAFRVSHPKHGSVKSYHVKVRGVPTERIIEKLQRGITIEGKKTLPAEIERLRITGRSEEEGNSWFEVRLREGRTQQIRKMFQAVGHPVVKLRRVAIGPIRDDSLKPGDWRELTRQELKMLMAGETEPRAVRAPRKERPESEKKRATAKAAAKKGAKKTPKKTAKKTPKRAPAKSAPRKRPATAAKKQTGERGSRTRSTAGGSGSRRS